MATNKQAMIAKDLANKIKFQQYQPGDLLPSESALCELYGTARGTIRKALDQLTELGLIQRCAVRAPWFWTCNASPSRYRV